VAEMLGYSPEVAHVNFGLRGEESDGDEEHVRNVAKGKGVMLNVKKVDSTEWDNKSVQERAREIRYGWFSELAAEKKFEAVFLGHHAGDQAETILLNLFRGTGFSGMKGILPKNGLWVRPLLEFSKAELLQYARENHLIWREDSSNSKTEYRRNAIRHNLMPAIRNIFPGLEKVMRKEALRFRLAANALNHMMQELEKKFHLKNCLDGKGYDFRAILQHPLGDFFLLEMTKANGFATDVFEELKENQPVSETRYWKSPQHRVLELKGNECWIWEKEEWKMPDSFLEIMPGSDIQGFQFLQGDENLIAPFRLLPWEPGDKMRHNGMEKKVSDLLTSQKLTRMQKKRVFKLVNNEGVIGGLLIPEVQVMG
jgi:tRNA(Ile)-lysidine synthase